jgi:hypothetical protein
LEYLPPKFLERTTISNFSTNNPITVPARQVIAAKTSLYSNPGFVGKGAGPVGEAYGNTML